jgi:tryptophan synthase alpha chain
MGRIDDIFADLKASGRRGLMPFICGGHPVPGVTADALPALSAAGAAIIEVGIPFSDPIADGSVIAAAMHTALTAGATPRTVFEEVAKARASTSAGIVAMVSVSIVHRMGGAVAFCATARDAGFDGLIVPDSPLEESDALIKAAADHGLSLSLLIAPSTPFKRAETIAKACTGFVYMLARSGITGEQSAAPDVEQRVSKLRTVTDLPIACGFGISTADHVRAVVRHADAAIVGSALVRRMNEAGPGDAARAAADFSRQLAQGLGQAQPAQVQ